MERLTRSECIHRMQKWLAGRLQGDEDTVCDVAAREGVFCRGFDRFPTPILKKSFPWLSHDPNLTREQLLERVRKWIHAREFVLDEHDACDLMACEKDMCTGWQGFNDEKVSATYEEMFGEPVEIIPEMQV